MKLLKNEWLQLLILAAPFCAAALLWDKLPARVPIHWNIHGQIDGYAGKAFGVLFMPLLNIFLASLLAAIPLMDPKIRKYDDETKASSVHVIKILRLGITLFNDCVAFAILAFALDYRFDMNRFVTAGIGLLFILLGNVMGKLRPNYFAGIRTPWTLESRTVWFKTHRLGGRLMVAGGICVLFASFLLPGQQYLLIGTVPFVLLMAIIPAVYSYFCYRSEKNSENHAA
jgi:uncharacterized membrane protein